MAANKSKFYTLAQTYWPDIQHRKQVEFIKYPRVRDYGLIFQAGSMRHRLFLSVCGGRVLLADEWSMWEDDGSETKGREVYPLTLDELRRFRMIEDVPGKAVKL